MESNPKYSIEFLPSALHDVTEIVSSFAMLGSKHGAIRIKDRINKAVMQISLFPYSGVSVSDEKMSKFDFHMMIIEKYLMFYRIFDTEQKVLIYRVLNGKQNYPTILKRLQDSTQE